MLPWDFVLVSLCAASIHRLWLYEDIFARPRSWAAKLPGVAKKPFLCPPCFAFYACALAVGLSLLGNLHPFWELVEGTIAAYMPLRLLIFWYDRVPKLLDTRPELPASIADSIAESFEDTSFDLDTPVKKTPCASCGDQKREVANTLRALNRVPFLIASPLNAFVGSYSLCTAIIGQARAAVEAGFAAMIVVQDDFDLSSVPSDWHGDPRYIIVPALPTFEWKEDEVDEENAKKITTFFRDFLAERKRGVLVTHDMLFQSWFTTHAKALHDLGAVDGWQILHTAHSAPGQQTERTENVIYRTTLPEGHKLISLSHADMLPLANQYHTAIENIITIPNAFDILEWVGAADPVRDMVNKTGILEADVVQTLPISLPRMGAKGILDIFHIFGALKEKGRTVRLIIADAHGDDEARRHLWSMAESQGLNDKDVVLTSRHLEGDGVARSDLQVLFAISNVFIFPSRSEACPLSVIEAAYSRNLLVLNSSLPVLLELVGGASCLWFGFGSASTPNVRPLSVQDVAEAILDKLENDPVYRAWRRIHERVQISHNARLLETLKES